MPYSTLVLTAGISALARRNHIGQALREEGSPLNFPTGQQNPVPQNPNAAYEDTLNDCITFLQGIEIEQTDCISAEFSLAYSLRESGELTKGAILHLVHTPTLGGRLAVALQRPHLESALNIQVEPQELSVPFDPSQRGGLALASGAFIGTVSNLLKDYAPHTAAFAPIGGYKVMVALGHTAASFHGFESLYLHEDSQQLQRIAPSPVALTSDLRTQLSPVARRVGNGAAWKELAPEERDIIGQHRSFFTRVDDLVELNELGQYLRLNETPVLLSSDARTTLEGHPDIRQQIFNVRDRAVANPRQEELNHQVALNAYGNNDLYWNLYKQGRSRLRIAWRLQKEGFLVHHIWTDHDQYERDINAGQILTDPTPVDLDAYQDLAP